MKKIKIDEQLTMDLYQKNMSDRKIGEILGVSKMVVYSWRKTNNLPANQHHLIMDNRKLYAVWGRMNSRCNNPHDSGYKGVGSKGIKVCEEWHSSAVFIEWARGHGYNEGFIFCRKNNELDYSPDNCMFVSCHTTGRCQSNNVNLTVNGETRSAAEWARKIFVTRSLISFWTTKSGSDYAAKKIAERLESMNYMSKAA